MMWYAIMAEDNDDSLPRRAKARDAHIARVEALVAEGRLLIAGPHPAIDAENPGEAGYSGSLVVAEFASLDDATAWAEADPYVESGAYRSVTVKPFKLFLP